MCLAIGHARIAKEIIIIKEKENKEKEIKKLRQTLEVKESTIDEYRWVACSVRVIASSCNLLS